MALGRENMKICLQDGQFVYKTGRGPTSTNKTTTIWRFPDGGPERGNPAMATKRLRQGVKEPHQHTGCGKESKNGGD